MLSQDTILKDLNDAQREAVRYDGGHLLIVAGPGTGKTHTLTRRIGLLSSRLKEGERVLGVTFTRKAAAEMEVRLDGLGVSEKAETGTFHQFAQNLLRRFAGEAGVREDFEVAGEKEQEQTAKAVWPDLTQAQRRRQLEQISFWKGTTTNGAEPGYVKAYNAALRARGFLDFDDLLREAVRLLDARAGIVDTVRRIYRFICVDEYQDLNPVQNLLLQRLAANGPVVTAIGDPNQAIYGFRGAATRFFESFSEDFPDARTVSLSDNYRSAEHILRASAQVMAAAALPDVPSLTARLYLKGDLIIHDAPTDKAEAEYVVHTIEKMVGGTSMFSQDSGRVTTEAGAERGFGDIAVLYRLKAQKHALEKAFARSGIPFQVSGERPLEDMPDFNTENVRLMTLHAAKGLEFPVVFIVGCEEGLLPLDQGNLKSDEDEERRLFYVGMTRAKERLCLVHARQRFLFGKRMANRMSPFLEDIEEQLKSFERSQGGRRPGTQNSQMTFLGQ